MPFTIGDRVVYNDDELANVAEKFTLYSAAPVGPTSIPCLIPTALDPPNDVLPVWFAQDTVATQIDDRHGVVTGLQGANYTVALDGGDSVVCLEGNLSAEV